MVSSAGGAEWIGVRVGLRGADLVLCRGGATQVISRSAGSKAGAKEANEWGCDRCPLMLCHNLATKPIQPQPGQQSRRGRETVQVSLAGSMV